MSYYCIMSNRHLTDLSFVLLNVGDLDNAFVQFNEAKEKSNVLGMAVSDEMADSLNMFFSANSSSYSYTYLDSPYTDETGDLYPLSSNSDWEKLLRWMNKTGEYSKPPSSEESINNSEYLYTYINNPFTNENGNFYPTPQNPDWELLINWMNKIGVYQKPPSVIQPEPEPTSLVDFDALTSSNYNIDTGEVTFIVQNSGNKDSTGSGGLDYRLIMEVTDNINDSRYVAINSNGTNYNINAFTHNGTTYYPRSIGEYNINLINTTVLYGGFGNTTSYTLNRVYINNFDATYLTNSPPLKTGHKIEFKFTGDFQALVVLI